MKLLAIFALAAFACFGQSLRYQTFESPATGAAVRNGQDRLADTYSLLDFSGVDKTGATDSSAAIANGWAQAGILAKGGTLTMPCGTFSIAHTVVLTSSFKRNLLGSGACTTLNWTGNATDPMLDAQGCSNCNIGNFYVTNSTPLKMAILQRQMAGAAYGSTKVRYHDITAQQGARFTISGCTNANPVVCTTDFSLIAGYDALEVSQAIAISGFTGSWASLNGVKGITLVDATHFSIGVDSTGFGTLAGTPAFTYQATFTIASATNTNPVVLTSSMPLWSATLPATVPLAVAGFTGSWAILNGPGQIVTPLSPTTFSLPIGSTGLGAMTGSPSVYTAQDFMHSSIYTFFFAGCPPGFTAGCVDGNNDQMKFDDVHVIGAQHSAFTLAKTQVFDVVFDHCSFLAASIGVEALDGSFRWVNSAAVGYSFGVDFDIPSVTADAIDKIEGVETENSHQFLNVTSFSYPGGGLSPNRVNVKLENIAHDGLGTGCTALQLATATCTPSGHYIQFYRPGFLSIDSSVMNFYGYHEDIFFSSAYLNLTPFNAAAFSVKDTDFGFGPQTAQEDRYGSTIADIFFTAGGGIAPASMTNSRAYDGTTGEWVHLGNYSAPSELNHLYNLDSVNFSTYNATVQNTLTATGSISAYSTNTAAAAFTGSGLNDATFGGLQTNPYKSTYKVKVYSTGMRPISAATNAYPVVFTSATAPTVSQYATFAGFTGAWAVLNGPTPSGRSFGFVTPISGTTFSIAVDTSTFGPMTGTPTWSLGGSDQWIYQSNGGGFGGGPVTITGATCAGSVVTAVGTNGLLGTNGELATITGITPAGYNVTLAPATYVDATHFTYPVPSCPGAYVTGGTLAAWVGPKPILGGQNPPQNLSAPGLNDPVWNGLTIQFLSKTGHTVGDEWDTSITQNQSVPVLRGGINGGGTPGTGAISNNDGPIECGTDTSGHTWTPCIGGGTPGSGPVLVQNQFGFGIADRASIASPWAWFDSVTGSTVPGLAKTGVATTGTALTITCTSTSTAVPSGGGTPTITTTCTVPTHSHLTQ